MSHTLTGFQVIKKCIKYLDIHPHKPISYPSGSKITRLIWGGNKAEEYTTQTFLEFHLYADHTLILNIKRPLLEIIHTIIGIKVCCKLQIQPAASSDSTAGEIIRTLQIYKEN